MTEQLARELAAVGIRGRLRRRILAEAEEHVRDAGSAEGFGDPRALANRFAAELGADASRRAAFASFGALAVAGAVYAAAFVSLGRAALAPAAPTPWLADLAAAVAIVAPQVAFVAGVLAALRALRRREAVELPTAELALVNRRTGTALAFGLVALAAWPVYAAALGPALAGWWRTLVYAGCGGAMVLLAAAGVPVVAAARLRPRVAGGAGDLFDDLRLTPYRNDPWRFARHAALVVFAVTTAAGVVRADPFDGALRGVLEAALCLAGFGVLGRFLGLRR